MSCQLVAALAGFRFDFVADLFRVRGCFSDLGALSLASPEGDCCSAGMDAGFFRRASRCLFLSRK
jgi:hypothetical protein